MLENSKPRQRRISKKSTVDDRAAEYYSDDSSEEFESHSCCERLSRWMQDSSYQLMANTIWDYTVSGFTPGRAKAFELLDVQHSDRILLIGEGSGLDFACLPQNTSLEHVHALDYSSEMVKQSKTKAKQHGIPVTNIIVADAQHLPYEAQSFDKIFFPLSLASIPNPKKAIQEAERVLAPMGKIVVYDKLMDEEQTASCGRSCLNFFTRSIFADINRKLPGMLGKNSSLKITHYESMEGKLKGYFARTVGSSYRVAMIVRDSDFPQKPSVQATIAK